MKQSIKLILGGAVFCLPMLFTSCGNIDNPLEILDTSGGGGGGTPTVEDVIKYGFKVTDLAGVDRTEAVTSLKMSNTDGGEVATAEVSDGKITIKADDLATAGITEAADFWFEATIGGNPYIAKVNIDPATLSPELDKTLAMATLGNIIGSDGKFYANKTAVDAADKTGVAMIVYLGNEGETDPSYKRGLAIALSDASDGTKWGPSEDAGLTKYNTWCSSPSAETDANTDMAGIANTTTLKGNGDAYAAAKAADAYSVAGFTPSTYSFSGWFLPSAGQWYKFLNDLCGLTWSGNGESEQGAASLTTVNATFINAGYDTDAAKFENCHYYWSSTESSNSNARSVNFYSEGGVSATSDEKVSATSNKVRPFLAF